MIIRRINFNNPQLSHLKSDKFYNKNLISKPAVHKRNLKYTDDIDLFIKQKKETAKRLNDEAKRWYEQIERLENESKDFVISYIEHSIKRTLTPEEKIKLKELMW